MEIETSLRNSSIPVPSLLVVCTILAWLIPKIYIAYTSPLRKLPGPYYSRFTNLRLKFAVVTGHRIHYIHDQHQKYGSVVRLSPTEVSIADADGFRMIYRPASGFLKSDWYRRFTNRPVVGIFDMTDPHQHSARRKLFARAFAKHQIRSRWEGMVRSKAEVAIRKFGEELERNGSADILKWFFFLATDVSGHLIFGQSFGTLEEGKKTRYIDTLQSVAKGGGIAVELPFAGIIGRLLPYTLFRANKYIFEYGKKAVQNSRDPESDQASIFTQLEPLDTKDPTSHALTELDINTEAGNLMIAGTDTTAYTGTYIIWTVLRYPGIQAALEEEVGALPENFCDTDLEALPLLNAVNKEVLRLYGAVPGSMPRVVPKGGVEIAGYFIPERTTISGQTWTVHRDENLWPDAKSFKPDRWLSETSPDSGKAVWAPFGAGSRICIGMHLAMMEMRYTTAMFFRNFRGASLAPETASGEIEFENFFMIKPKSGTCFIVKG